MKMGKASYPTKDFAGRHRSVISVSWRDFESETSVEFVGCGNDPSAGSPTETLLRLHLPLDDEV